MRIILIFDFELPDQIRGRKIGEAFPPDDRYGTGCLQDKSRLGGINRRCLQIDQGLIVVRCVTRNGHDDTRAIIWFYEASREDRDLAICDRVPDSLPHQLAYRDLAFYDDFVILVLKLLHRLPTYDPDLSVHLSSNIDGFWVDPEIGHPENSLRSQSRSGIEHLIFLKLDQVGFSYLRFHISLGIHNSNGAFVVGTPCNRMRAPRDQPFLV